MEDKLMRHFPAKQRRNFRGNKSEKFKSTAIVDGKKHCQWWSVRAVKSGSIPLAKQFPRKSGARM